MVNSLNPAGPDRCNCALREQDQLNRAEPAGVAFSECGTKSYFAVMNSLGRTLLGEVESL